jgi:hypothetical protein
VNGLDADGLARFAEPPAREEAMLR